MKIIASMMITEGYDTFVSRCAEGRHMTKEAIERLPEGRVWTGETAKKCRTGRRLGGIAKALDIAVAKAVSRDTPLFAYPAKQDFFSPS
jgi:protease-4